MTWTILKAFLSSLNNFSALQNYAYVCILFLGVRSNRGIRTEDWRSFTASNIRRRKRERQVCLFKLQVIAGYVFMGPLIYALGVLCSTRPKAEDLELPKACITSIIKYTLSIFCCFVCFFQFESQRQWSIMNVFYAFTKLLFSKRIRENTEPEFWCELFLEWLLIFRPFHGIISFLFLCSFFFLLSDTTL